MISLLRKLLGALGGPTATGMTHVSPVHRVSRKLDENLAELKEAIGNADDLILRRIRVGRHEAAIIYLSTLTKPSVIELSVLRPLMQGASMKEVASDPLALVQDALLPIGRVEHTKELERVTEAVLAGDTAMIISGTDVSLIVGTKEPPSRNISEPQTESVVRGAHEGFTESLETNVGLIRKRLQGAKLYLESMKIGAKTATTVMILYICDLASEELVETVRKRLKSIRTDAILESGYLEQFIEDHPYSPFSTIANSERADVVVAKILEGRVAILTDGTPYVLTVPMLFAEGFQAPEDYYSRPYYVSLVRFTRYIGFAISVLGTPIYVALSAFHQELIPTGLLITMAASAEGTPLPVVAEVLLMGLFFEILREAGIRLPRAIGQAVSIVGTLVIGQAAIQAGIVGAPVVIVISITALASFLVVPHTDVGALLRLIYIL